MQTKSIIALIVMSSVTLFAGAMTAGGAEPTGRDTTRAAPAARKPATQTITSSTHSILGADSLAMAPSPYVLYPDLIPAGTSFVSSCTWNPSAGETCESKCPPIEINLPFGTKNESNRALSGPGTVKVFQRPSGQLLKTYPFNGLAARAQYMPASIKRLLVRCHTGSSVSGTPPATHDLVIETAAKEADKNNNSKTLHLLPNDQLVLP